MRTFWHIGGALTAVLFVAGCTSPAAPDPISGPGAKPAGEEQLPVQRGGTFQTVGIRELSHLDPWRASPTANAGFFLGAGVYDQLLDFEYLPLTDWREESKISPSLAERWEVKDNRSYTFHLRKNVKWHDGQPFTARDVKFSLEQLLDPANRLPGGSTLKAIDSINLIDDYTIQVSTKEPDVDFLDNLTEDLVVILPKHVHDRGDSFEKVAIGTGPFKVESFQRGQPVVYTANRDYWIPDRPYLDKWKILPPADEAGRTAAFFARQNDVLKVANKAQAETVLASAPTAKVYPFYRSVISELFLKLDRPPFNDLRVRQALHLAIDRQEMVGILTAGDGLMNPPGINVIYKSLSLPAGEFESLPGWRSPKNEDLARARQLLAEAGQPNLSFTIKVDRSHPDRPAIGEMLTEQMRRVGVDAKLQLMESASYFKSYSEGDYETALENGSDPQRWHSTLHSSGVLNKMPIKDPELDRLIEAQAREFDDTKRAQLLRDMQRRLIQQAYVMPFFAYPGYMLRQPYIHGWSDNLGANVGNKDWGQTWIDQSQAPRDR